MSHGIKIINEKGEWENFYIPTPKQEEFHARTEPNVLFWGGRGSGKSAALRNEAHARALACPGFTYLILRRTYPELQKSHLVHVPREMKKLGGTFHYTDKIATYPNGSRGFFSHCATEEDALNLLSAEFAWMGFDELSTFPWEMFLKLAASVRVPKNSGLTAMVRAATNPLGPSAQDVKTFFVTKDVDYEEYPDYNPNEWHSIHANLEDNPHLDQEQYKKRFSGLAAHIRKAWVDGEFILENSIFDFQPSRLGQPWHVVDYIDLPAIVKAARIFRVYDHGYAPDPAYCAWIAHLGNRYIVIHEKIWIKEIVSDIAASIKEEDAALGIERVIECYCDPTIDIHTGTEYRTIKGIFESHGVPMECSVNNREQFASAIHTALAEEVLIKEADNDGPEVIVPRLQIYVPSRKGTGGAPYMARAIPMQQYNPKRPLAMADNAHDHPVVALAYFLISHSSTEHKPYKAGSVPRWMRPKKAERFVLGREGVRDRF